MTNRSITTLADRLGPVRAVRKLVFLVPIQQVPFVK